jgi:putative flippase GtrA
MIANLKKRNFIFFNKIKDFFGAERNSKILKTIFKHGIVSLICGSLEYVLFLLIFVKMSQPLIISYVIPFALATIIGYLGHNFFTFKYKVLDSISLRYYFIQVTIVLLVGFFVIKMLLFLMIPQLAKLIQLISTFAFNVYFGNYFTFNKSSRNVNFNGR